MKKKTIIIIGVIALVGIIVVLNLSSQREKAVKVTVVAPSEFNWGLLTMRTTGLVPRAAATAGDGVGVSLGPPLPHALNKPIIKTVRIKT